GIRDRTVTGVQTCALPISIDATKYGADARLLNLTHRPELGCSSYQVSMVPLRVAQVGGGVIAAGPAAIPEGIAVGMHYSGSIPRSEERRVGKEGQVGRGRG